MTAPARPAEGILADCELVDLASASGLFWASPAITLVGLGAQRRIPLDRPGGGREAQARLHSLGEGDPDEWAHGAVAFISMPFAPDEPAELFVPDVVIAEDRTGRWVTGAAPGRAAALAEEAISTPAPPWPEILNVTTAMPPDEWRDHVVTTARDRIRAGELQKTVLARLVEVHTDRDFDEREVVRRLHERFPSTNVFLVDGFVGASPELLVARRGRAVRAHPLAGTAPRVSDPAVDAANVTELLESTKDQAEHRITIDWFLTELLPFCSYVDAEPEPTIVSVANVHHLATLVEGVLSAPPPSVLDLVAALHPTPAVGGDPQATALQTIGELEGFDRGRYAGPTGWVDAAGNGEFAVSVRSAQLRAGGASVCAGVGVVAASDPEAELRETQAKFRAVLGALLG